MAEEAYDPGTGEVQREPQREVIEGEIAGADRAADGGLVPYGATTAGDIVNMIEDGALSAEMVASIGDLIATMTDMAAATGNKQKGSVTLKLDFATEGGPFMVKAGFTVRKPKEIRPATVLFSDEQNRLSRTQPRQRQFFGVRTVSSAGPVRKI